MKQVLLIVLVVALTVGAMAAGAGIYKWTMVDANPPVATPAPALSRCESLTQQVAQAETEMGAAFLIQEWEQKGCAPPKPTPTPEAVQSSTEPPQFIQDLKAWSPRNLRPEVRLNRSLINGLLKEYVSDESNPSFECLKRPTIGIWSSIEVRRDIDINVEKRPGSPKWTIRASRAGCNGVETWEIDDATGAITYLGSSTAP